MRDVFAAFLILVTCLILALYLFIRVGRVPRKGLRTRVLLEDLSPSALSSAVKDSPPRVLSYNKHNFTLDGQSIRIISGAVHYFRIPPSRWRSALLLARRMGLNAVETYIAWNLHEPVKGVFRFSGMLDLPRFLSLAHEAGLLVLLRPGPYICSEWDFGGLPPYLLADSTMYARTLHGEYMKAVHLYINALVHVVKPYVGRPVVAIQIENEYGRYGVDRAYMHALVEIWNNAGFSRSRLVHFTSDNGGLDQFRDGSPFSSASVLKTINFGGHVDANMQMLRTVQHDAPAMVGEFWVGWFDHWGMKHNVRSAKTVTDILRSIVFDYHASVNLYMFMGGTNFGFMAGANLEDDGVYRADTTSYDYDAFVTEYGEVHVDKFEAARTLLSELWSSLGDNDRLAAMDDMSPRSPYLSSYAGRVRLTASVFLLDVLDFISGVHRFTRYPRSIETIGGDYGYVLYRHNMLSAAKNGSVLQLHDVHDYAHVLFDGLVLETVDRNRPNDTLADGSTVAKRILVPAGTLHVDILVENSGRVNYGMGIHDRKGLLGNVTFDNTILKGFDMYGLSFPQDHPWLRDVYLRRSIDDVIKVMKGRFAKPLYKSELRPTIFYGVLAINRGASEIFGDELPSTYCRIFGRGTLWVNGFNVGRFNTNVPAPQRSLFVPGSLLREGKNDIVVLHTDIRKAHKPAFVEFSDHADFGPV